MQLFGLYQLDFLPKDVCPKPKLAELLTGYIRVKSEIHLSTN